MKCWILLGIVLMVGCELKNNKINRYNDLNVEIQQQFQGLDLKNVFEINPADHSTDTNPDLDKQQSKNKVDNHTIDQDNIGLYYKQNQDKDKDKNKDKDKEKEKEQSEVDEFSQIINDINTNQFVPPVSFDDKFQENSKKMDKKTYQEMIDQNVQSQMDQIQKEAEEEARKDTEREKKIREFKMNRINIQKGLGISRDQKPNDQNISNQNQNKGVVKQQIQKKPNMRFFEIDDGDVKTNIDDSKELQQNYQLKENKKDVKNNLASDQQMLIKDFQIEEFKQLQDAQNQNQNNKVDNGIYNPARDDLFGLG